MNKLTKILLIFLCGCLFVCAIPALANNETSGKCGKNVTWNFDEATNTLTISGTGPMDNSPFGREMRWRHLYERIYHIVVEDGITSICDYAFEGSVRLQTVSIAQSVTSIGDNAFVRTGLAHIDLHDGITYIGVQAFEASHLEEVRIPAGVTTLSGGVFRNSKWLADVVLHDGITQIGSNAFSACTALQSIVIPDSVVFMDGFTNCTALKEITLSCNTRIIATCCFQGCTSLEEIFLPDSVEKIGNSAFENCTSLRAVSIGPGISELDHNVFKGCSSLIRIMISAENPWLCSDAYGVVYSKDRTQLLLFPAGITGEYTVAEGTQTIQPHAGRGCLTLTGLVLPDSVTSIEPYALYGCVALRQLDLGAVQKIRSSAFHNCEALEILTIPVSVTHVEHGAFSGCESLRVIEFLGDCPLIESFVFSGVKGDAYYPAGNTTWENNFPEDARHLTWHPGCVGGHSFVDVESVMPTCAEEGETAYAYCEMCNILKVLPYKIPMLEHRFGPWTYMTPAGTALSEGIVRRNCEVCGTEQREYTCNIDPSLLPETPVDPTEPNPTEPSTTEPNPTEPSTTEPNPTEPSAIEPDAQPEEPVKSDADPIVILVIVVVATCFIGVEVYLVRKKKCVE